MRYATPSTAQADFFGHMNPEMGIAFLAWPGAKQYGAKHILPWFPKDLKEMCSPFIGGGAIELICAKHGVHVYGYDIDRRLTLFWRTVRNHRAEVVSTAKALLEEHGMDYHIAKAMSRNEYGGSAAMRCAQYYICNRMQYVGSDGYRFSTKRMRQDPLISDELWGRIMRAPLDRMHIQHGEFQDSLAAHWDKFVYLDPPYKLPKGKDHVYGNGKYHKFFDHSALAEILLSRGNWILSYNDCNWVRNAYQDCKIIDVAWNYNMRSSYSSRHTNELLIVRR